MVDTVTILP